MLSNDEEIHLIIPGYLFCPEWKTINHSKRANSALLVSFIQNCILVLVVKGTTKYPFCHHPMFVLFLPFIQLILLFFPLCVYCFPKGLMAPSNL